MRSKQLKTDRPRLHNSTLRVSSSKRMKRSWLTRSRKPMNRVGRRTKDWRKAWRFLKVEFERRGRTSCEFEFIPHECWGPLDPAHSKKRRNMKGNDIYACAIACRYIHNFLDLMCTHEEMELFVMRAIELAGGLILPEEKQAA
jgi:hypothetical protein